MLTILCIIAFVVGFLMFVFGGVTNALHANNKISWEVSDNFYETSFGLGSCGLFGFLLCVLL